MNFISIRKKRQIIHFATRQLAQSGAVLYCEYQPMDKNAYYDLIIFLVFRYRELCFR